MDRIVRIEKGENCYVVHYEGFIIFLTPKQTIEWLWRMMNKLDDLVYPKEED